jgi:hypothetical protein
MTNSWLTAHAVFVSGITMLYCLWTCPEVRKCTRLKTFLLQAESCTKLLSALGKTWSVAKNSQAKFDQLVQLTKDSWNLNQTTLGPEQGAGNTAEAHAHATNIPEALDGLPKGFWDGLDVEFEMPPNMLMDELGGMGTWFDLD